jgi:hypothetical protein
VTIVVPITRPQELRGQPLRWRKIHGQPTCLIEQILQHTWLLVPYIALVVTLMLILQLKGM